MVDLKYDLDEIQDFAVEPGKYRARLTKVEQTLSKAKKPMLVWNWKIISGSEKGTEMKSWTSLQKNALGALKAHLQAFGFEGKIKTKTSRLVGKRAILVVALRPGVNEAGEEREYSNIIALQPYDKSAPAEEIEEEDEDWDEEIEDEDEDEDWEDEDEDEIEEEEEPAPKKKRKKRRKKKDDDLPF